MCLGSSLTKAINPTTLLSRFLFSSYLYVASSLHIISDCPLIPYWKFRLTTLENSIIVRYSESDLLLFDGLPLILTTLIVYWLVLLLILIIQVRPCISLMFIWSIFLTHCILSSDVNIFLYFECQLGRQKNSWEKHQLHFYSLTFYVFNLLTFSSVYGLFEGRIKASNNAWLK